MYPKSFCDSNGDGIGDLRGIISKLDYLKELGVDIIWLSPIYCSPLADQGYDISDYYNIDPRFGTMEDMEELIAEAKKRDMHILMDLVVNHCSDEHEWFKKACEDPDGKYGKYFYIKDYKDGKLPCNWRSYFGGPVWEPLPGHLDKCYLHVFHKKQPDLNWENPELREEIYTMINWWLDKGLAGFRIDAIINIKKALPFKDYPADRDDGLAPIQLMLKEATGVGEFLGEMRDRTFAKYDAFTAGEVFDEKPGDLPPLSATAATSLPCLISTRRPSVKVTSAGMLQPASRRTTTGTAASRARERSATSDSSRISSRTTMNRAAFPSDIPDGEVTPTSKKLLATMNVMLRGLPFIYQGQEIGMENMEFTSIDQIDDIATLDEYEVSIKAGLTPEEAMKVASSTAATTPCTPFQWNDKAHAGFTTGTPWLTENPNYTRINLESQRNDPDSVYQYYRKLTALRKNPEYAETVVYGECIPVWEDRHNLMAYYRKSSEKTLLVIGNYQTEPQTVTLPQELKKVVLNNLPTLVKDGKTLTLAGYQAVVLEV
ncbi:MAG: alpha-glucosidase [Lachnospiraceae bacterium]